MSKYFISLLFEWPIFATKIVDVKSINLLLDISYTAKSFALFQTIGSCPCIDLDSLKYKCFKILLVPGAGIEVLIFLNLVLIDFTGLEYVKNLYFII